MKNRLTVFASALVVTAVILALVPSAIAQMPKPFSADMSVTPGSREGADSMNGKVYFGGQKFRMDMSARGHNSIIISDITNKVSYMLMPQQQMYMEMRHDSMMMGRGHRPEFKPYDASNPCANEEDTTCKKVGTELVEGRTCDKWEFTKNGSLTRTVWIDKSTHIPIKTLQKDGTVVEFKNIQEGPQPASLFEIPSGYQKMDMGNMMGQRPPR